MEKDLILVIDDIQQTLDLIGHILSKEGYEVKLALNHIEALSFLENNTPELILLDVSLPEIDGFDLYNQIRELPNCAEMPIIFVSAYVDKNYILQGLKLGAVNYITKPFSAEELILRVNKQLETSKLQKRLLKKSEEVSRLNNELLIEIEEHRKVEAELNELMRSRTTLLNNLPGIAFRCSYDKLYSMEFISDGCFELTGYSPLELIDDLIVQFSEIIYKEDLDFIIDNLAEAKKSKSNYEINYRIVTKDNIIKWVWEKAQFIYDHQGKPIAIEGLINDITQRKEAEGAYLESKTIFNAFLDYCPIFMFFKDENLINFRLSKSYEHLFKQPLKLLTGKTNDELYDTETARKLNIEDKLVLKENKLIKINEEYLGRIYETIKFPIVIDSNKRYIAGFSTDITDRKLFEQKLIDSEEKFSKAFITSPYAIIITEYATGMIFEFNNEFMHLTGYQNYELRNKSTYDINLWEDRDFRRTLLNSLLEHENIKNIEVRIRTKENKIVFCLLNAANINIKNTKYILGILIDITERKKIELELRENEQRFRNIIDNSLDGFFRINLKGYFVFVNDAFVKMFAYDNKQEILDLPPYYLFNSRSEQKNLFLEINQQGFVKDKTLEMVKKDHTTFWFSVNAHFFKDIYNNVIGIEGFARDVTSSIQHVNELIQSEAKYKLRSESSSDVIWVLDINTLKFTYVSPAITKLLGYEPHELINNSFENILTLKSFKKVIDIISTLLNKQNLGEVIEPNFTTEIVQIRKDKKLIVTEIATTLIYDEFNVLTGILGNTRDITQRKKTELYIKKKVKIEKSLLSISNRFIQKNYINLEDVINYALKEIAIISKADLVAYYKYSNGDVLENIYYWKEESNNYHYFFTSEFERYIFKKFAFVKILKNKKKYNRIQELNDISYIYLPIYSDKKLLGIIGIVSQKVNKKWEKTDLRLVKVVGELISNELSKQELEEKRKSDENELIKLRQGVEQSANSIEIMDTLGKIVYVNPAFEKITGYSYNELIGKNSIILSIEDKNINDLWGFISSGNKWTGEFVNTRKNGEVFWELASVSPIKNNQNEIVNFIAIKEDITKRKLDEEKLIYSNRKLQVLSEFYYAMNFSSSESELFKAIVYALSGLDSYNLIGLYDIINNDNSNSLNLIYSNGMQNEILYEIENNSKDQKSNSNPFIDTIVNKKIVIYNDLPKEWKFSPIKFENTRFNSLFISPILYRNQQRYLIVILSEKKNVFNDYELIILDDLTNFLSLGIDFMHSKEDKIRIEEFIKKEKEELNITLSSINDAVITLDKEYKVVLTNKVVDEILEFEKPIINMHISQVFDLVLNENNQIILDKYIKLINNSDPEFNHENIIISNNNNKRKIINIKSAVIFQSNSTDSRIVISFRDITERIKLENQLAISQKMDSVGQLAAGIAHEMNTPLQYVGNNTMFLSDAYKDMLNYISDLEKLLLNDKYIDANLSEEIRNNLNNLNKSYDLDFLKKEIPLALSGANTGIQKVSKIISAMKNFAHPSGSMKSSNNINEALETIITISKNEWKYSLNITLDLEPNLPLVYCAIDEINQVILNMILNSTHAIQEKFKETNELNGLIEISTRSNEEFVSITIKDNGIGISKDNIDRIFDPFFTTKEIGKGTGQGLSISHNIIVNRHKGTIEVDSIVNRGTTFKITLPIN